MPEVNQSAAFPHVVTVDVVSVKNGVPSTAPNAIDNSLNSINSGTSQCTNALFLAWCLQLTYTDFNITIARELIPNQKTVCRTTKDLLGFSTTTCNQENVPSNSALNEMGNCLGKNTLDDDVNATLGSMPSTVAGSEKTPCQFQRVAFGQYMSVSYQTTPITSEQCSALINRFQSDVDGCAQNANAANLQLLGLLALLVIPAVIGVCVYRKVKHGTGFSEQGVDCIRLFNACTSKRQNTAVHAPTVATVVVNNAPV